ncbi:MAG: glycosyltransferase family 1 protein [Rhodoluna sp.]|nr:glycosyltransferase family 1 protein [Rhodoluna sp.]
MKQRVVIVTESFLPSLNGVTNSVLRILDTLHSLGHEVLIIAPTSPVDEYLGFKVIKTKHFHFKQFPVALPLMAMKRIFLEFKPDVVHVAAPFALGNQALRVAKKLNIPGVAIYQTDISGYLQRYKLELLKPAVDEFVASIHRKAAITLAPTPETAANLTALNAGKVDVWGRGIDLKAYDPSRKQTLEVEALRAKYVRPGNLLVGFVGRLAAEKQVERMSELFGLPGVNFLIVGDGPERAALEQEFKGKPVTFAGRLEGEALANAYAALDVFVHFGTEETFGQTIQEAQASQLPVIAPARGGPIHLIQDGVTGFLVDPDQSRPYRARLIELLGDEVLRRRIAKQARESVLGRTWERNNDRLLEHYQNAIQDAKVRRL